MPPSPLELIPPSAQKTFSLQKGELLFRQGDSTDGLFYVEQGVIELHRYTATGECLTIHRAKTMETFAEASLFSAMYHCDAVAIESSLGRKFDKHAVLSLFATEPGFALGLTARFATQIQVLRRRLELLAVKDAKERVFVAITDNMLTGSITTLALDIGLTHETTYRALASLAQEGRVVKISRGCYRIR